MDDLDKVIKRLSKVENYTRYPSKRRQKKAHKKMKLKGKYSDHLPSYYSDEWL